MDQKQLALIAVFAVGAWVAWLIFSAVRQYMTARMQAAAQDKLLLRLSSPESLQVFLASEAGVRFLRSIGVLSASCINSGIAMRIQADKRIVTGSHSAFQSFKDGEGNRHFRPCRQV